MSTVPKTKKFTLKRIVENLDTIPADGGFKSAEAQKLTPEQKRKLLEMTSKFNEYGSFFEKSNELQTLSNTLHEIFGLAETYALNECGDWFQGNVVKRDFAQSNKRVQEFVKLAKACHSQLREMAAIYEDCGHVINRYFDVADPLPQPGIPPKTDQTMASNL